MIKDQQSCTHAFVQAVTAVKLPRNYSRQTDATNHWRQNHNQYPRGHRLSGKFRSSSDPQVPKSDIYYIVFFIYYNSKGNYIFCILRELIIFYYHCGNLRKLTWAWHTWVLYYLETDHYFYLCVCGV